MTCVYMIDLAIFDLQGRLKVWLHIYVVKSAFVSLGDMYRLAEELCEYCMVHILCFSVDFVHTELCNTGFLYCCWQVWNWAGYV